MDTNPAIDVSEFLDLETPLWVTFYHPQKAMAPLQFESRILQLSEHQLLLEVPAFQKIQPYLTPHTQVELRLAKAPGDFPPLLTTCLYHQSSPLAGCWVNVSPAVKDIFLNQRRHVRVQARFPLTVFYHPLHKHVFVPAESVNLSGGGIRFASARQFRTGEKLRLVFQPDFRGQAFDLDGEVVLSIPAHIRHTQYASPIVTAVKFIHIPAFIEDRLVGICFRKETESKKHLLE